MKVLNDAHEQEYGEKPAVTSKSPCRFHLLGEHSWFFKNKTISMAVNLPVYVAVSKRQDSSLKFYFHQLNERKHANLTSSKYKKEDRWANAIKSVVYGYISGGFDLGGVNFTVYSEILPSAGFGVTTAIKAATLLALKQLFSLNITEVQMLQVIERGNKLFLQKENHIADNFSALFAKKDNLIITDHQTNSWDYVPFPFEGKKIFLVDAKVPRVTVWQEDTLFEPQNALLLGDLRERKANIYGGWRYINNITDINEELSEVSEETRRRLLCMIREHGDVLDVVDSIQKIDFFKFARSINHSHESMRDFYDLSCPEIDWILKRVSELEPNLEMVTNPISCGRITGKGFGRCLYVVIRDSDEEKFKAKLSEFEKIFGYKTSCYEVTPSDGASIVRD
ncbi:MAG: galactokinase [Treponema sp.]|nr:galactokinase [Treponema sp.]